MPMHVARRFFCDLNVENPDAGKAYNVGVQRAFRICKGRSLLNGGGWTRTNGDRSRTIYSCLPFQTRLVSGLTF